MRFKARIESGLEFWLQQHGDLWNRLLQLRLFLHLKNYKFPDASRFFFDPNFLETERVQELDIPFDDGKTDSISGSRMKAVSHGIGGGLNVSPQINRFNEFSLGHFA